MAAALCVLSFFAAIVCLALGANAVKAKAPSKQFWIGALAAMAVAIFSSWIAAPNGTDAVGTPVANNSTTAPNSEPAATGPPTSKPTDSPANAGASENSGDSTSGPCDSAKLQGDAEKSASLLSQRGSTEVMAALSEQMNDENDCAESIANDDPSRMRHTKEAGKAALYLAVYGPDMFGSKKTNLQLAQQFEQSVLGNSNADDSTRKDAQDIMNSASEKLSDVQ